MSERIEVGSTLRERLMARIEIVPWSGCWIWTGCLHSKGYGEIFLAPGLGKTKAHRASWMVFRGPIPHGLLVCHRCDIRCCVNPNHLWLGTNQANILDAVSKGARFGVRQSEKTHCPSGHKYDQYNTYVDKRGGRHCKTCHDIRQRASYKHIKSTERKEEVPA